jgi:hypothetical protein
MDWGSAREDTRGGKSIKNAEATTVTVNHVAAKFFMFGKSHTSGLAPPLFSQLTNGGPLPWSWILHLKKILAVEEANLAGRDLPVLHVRYVMFSSK